MGSHLTSDNDNVTDLLSRLRLGDRTAVGELFAKHRDRLKRMVQLRLDRRLQARVDASDVLQETLLDASRKLDEYLADPHLPFFFWLRALAGLKLAEAHRHHLGTQLRDADRDVSIYRGALPEANSMSLAAQLLGKFTSPSQSALKAERRIKLQESLNVLDPMDREILALRHFEQLTNAETAIVLNLSESGATARHMRALKRLKSLLEQTPGFFN
jgi:RNA polymerase sigma-70 factor (ECF subfamily)